MSERATRHACFSCHGYRAGSPALGVEAHCAGRAHPQAFFPHRRGRCYVREPGCDDHLAGAPVSAQSLTGETVHV